MSRGSITLLPVEQNLRRDQPKIVMQTPSTDLQGQNDGSARRSHLPTARVKSVTSTKRAAMRTGALVGQNGDGVTRPKSSQSSNLPAAAQRAANIIPVRRHDPVRPDSKEHTGLRISQPPKITPSVASKRFTPAAQHKGATLVSQSLRDGSARSANGTRPFPSGNKVSIQQSEQPRDLSDEIIQLQLVQLPSDQMLRVYRRSLEHDRDTVTRSVAIQQMNMLVAERRQQHAASIVAVQSWRDIADGTAEQEVQTLSRIVDDLQLCISDLEDSKCIESFQAWLTSMLHGLGVNVSEDKGYNNAKSAGMPSANWHTRVVEIQQRLKDIAEALQGGIVESKRFAMFISLGRRLTLARILLNVIEDMTNIEQRVLRVVEAQQATDLENAFQQLTTFEHQSRVGVWRG